jgi:ribosome-binding factor A
MKILQENVRVFRGELGRQVGKQFRIVPELAFYLDSSLDYAQHIDDLLKQ